MGERQHAVSHSDVFPFRWAFTLCLSLSVSLSLSLSLCLSLFHTRTRTHTHTHTHTHTSISPRYDYTTIFDAAHHAEPTNAIISPTSSNGPCCMRKELARMAAVRRESIKRQRKIDPEQRRHQAVLLDQAPPAPSNCCVGPMCRYQLGSMRFARSCLPPGSRLMVRTAIDVATEVTLCATIGYYW